MKNYLTSILFILFFCITSEYVNGQSFDYDTVKLEMTAAIKAEQNAFKAGDCDKVLEAMEENITFLANGRKAPSKMMIGKFCNSIPRPFKTPTIDKLEIYPLTSDTGYVVRTLEFPKNEKTKTLEYVTKIWKKTDGKWRISHLHSTVKDIPISK
ncbi:nuclear transport factor 2 family protein [uncultured Aquimarina sp.]|uniref:nuclear transport factor 2 family protein n=1 Tax=uncultured Aquimarina sp. TaxID=575652 RepID=UPI00260AF76B|nr:nuclear transport factor 2 family protein [uncultured Aquimarina sp.]